MSDLLAVVKKLATDAEHHGVKGMRWGVRKDESSSPTPASADAVAAKAAAAKVTKKGSTDALNNSELQALVNRMNLERQDSTLSTSSKSHNAGVKFLKDIGTNVLRSQLTNAANMVIKNQLKQALKKKGLA